MPTYSLKKCVGSITPWDDLGNWFLGKPDGAKYFSDNQDRRAGFIVAWWRHEFPFFPPTHYLYNETYRLEDISWVKFGDESCSEDPKQYLRLKKALETIRKLREINKTERIGLTFWEHPESYHQPLADFIAMTEGSRFPGSPRW